MPALKPQARNERLEMIEDPRSLPLRRSRSRKFELIISNSLGLSRSSISSSAILSVPRQRDSFGRGLASRRYAPARYTPCEESNPSRNSPRKNDATAVACIYLDLVAASRETGAKKFLLKVDNSEISVFESISFQKYLFHFVHLSFTSLSLGDFE